jgi:ribosomal protein L30E
VPTLDTNRAKSGPKVQQLRVNDPNVSYIFKEDIVDKYGETFMKNIQKIQGVIKNYVQKYSSLYGLRAPTVRIPFTDYDKSDLFKAAGISSDLIKKSIMKLHANDINLKNRIITDPFNELCSILTGYYFQNKDRFKKPQNEYSYPYHFTSLYLTMKFYCSVYYRSFPVSDPSPDVMDYTIENLSRKFLLKKVNNVYDIVKYYSETIIENMEDRILRGADIDYVYFCTNLDTRIGGFMKSLAAQFYKNKEEKNRTQTETAARQNEEGEFFVGNTSNISSILESSVRKIITRFISDNTIDDSILNVACSRTKFSKPKLVIIINKIREHTDDKLKEVLSNIIMYYLLTSKKDISAIRSREFITTMINLYSISNTKNEIILKIKDLLEQIVTENSESILKEGNKNMIDRVKTSLYTYLVLFIAKNIE